MQVYILCKDNGDSEPIYGVFGTLEKALEHFDKEYGQDLDYHFDNLEFDQFRCIYTDQRYGYLIRRETVQ